MQRDPHKRNLIAVSSAIIIFYLGDGDIQSVTTLFGAVKLKSPEILLVSAWLILAYSFWQYWLRVKTHREEFTHSWKTAVRASSKFRDFAKARLADEGEYFDEKKILELIDTNIKSKNQGVTICGPIMRRSFLVMDLGRGEKILKQKWWSFSLEILAIKYMVKSGFLETHFSDYVLPYFFAAGAIVVAVTKSMM